MTSFFKFVVFTLFVCGAGSARAAIQTRGLAISPSAENRALIVGVPHGLDGIDIDLKNMRDMGVNNAYRFKIASLFEEEATIPNIARNLTQSSSETGEGGTFLFYFSGHGDDGVIWAEDDTISIKRIRSAIEAGRATKPLARLVMIFDSCFSGSLIDPVLPWQAIPEQARARHFVDRVVREMIAPHRNGKIFWKQLFVFASSRADETSLATENGSVFTLALRKAFDETIAQNLTLGEWVSRTQKYAEADNHQDHHPVARFVPESLSQEHMRADISAISRRKGPHSVTPVQKK